MCTYISKLLICRSEYDNIAFGILETGNFYDSSTGKYYSYLLMSTWHSCLLKEVAQEVFLFDRSYGTARSLGAVFASGPERHIGDVK